MAWGVNYKHDSLQAAIFKEDKQTNKQTQNKALLLKHMV